MRIKSLKLSSLWECDSKNIPAMCIDIQEAGENIASRAHWEVTGRLALEMGAPEQGAKRIL